MFALMIAAATAQSTSQGFVFGWFDIAVVAILGFGLYRGRRNGMSKELLPVLKWLIIVVVCGLAYQPIGAIIAKYTGMTKMWSNLMAYFVLMILIMIPFDLLKRHFAEKLAMTDSFKSSEYYLGMMAGTIRFGCILLVAMALLNARFYSQTEIKQNAAYNQQWFGGGEYGGDYFINLNSIQKFVFDESASGHFVKTGTLGALLIKSSPSDAAKANAPKKQPIIQIGGK
jgi:uncharacterized membrane protein required for colicin V production